MSEENEKIKTQKQRRYDEDEGQGKITLEEFCKKHGIPLRDTTKDRTGQVSIIFIPKRKLGNPTIDEDTWKYFIQFPPNASAHEYRLVPVERLIQSRTPTFSLGKPDPVDKAISHIQGLALSKSGEKKREPLTVTFNADGTYCVIDGNATVEAAKRLGWKKLPVKIVEELKP